MRITDLMDDYYEESVTLPEADAPTAERTKELTMQKLGAVQKKRRRVPVGALIAAACVLVFSVTAGAVGYSLWDTARESAIFSGEDIPEYTEYQDQTATGAHGSVTLISSLCSGTRLSVYVEVSPVTQEMADMCNDYPLGQWDAMMTPIWPEGSDEAELNMLLNGTTTGGSMVEYYPDTQTALLDIEINSDAFTQCSQATLKFSWTVPSNTPFSEQLEVWDYGILNVPVTQAEMVEFHTDLSFDNQYFEGRATVTAATLWAGSIELQFSLPSVEEWCEAHGGGSEAWFLIGDAYEGDRAEAYGYDRPTEYDAIDADAYYHDAWMDSWAPILQASYISMKDGAQVSLSEVQQVGGEIPSGSVWNVKYQLNKALDITQVASITIGGETFSVE